MLDRRLGLTFLLAIFVTSFGCDDGPTPPGPPNEDRARECVPEGEEDPEAGTSDMDGGASLSCASGEVCIQGRCYAECQGDGDCGPAERCSGGVCVVQVGPRPDAGGRDAGPGMPCDGVECPDPQVCHPLSGQCVQCSQETVEAPDGAPGACTGLQPICDIANGRCVERAPAQCVPCNLDEECDPGDGSFTGDCVLRDNMGWPEQVCLQVCDVMTPCPPGLGCQDGHCQPFAGASCTTWRAAVGRLACTADDDCNIRDTRGQSIFFVDACEGEMVPTPPDAGMTDGGGMPDAGSITPGVCVQPCGDTAECFDQAGGQMCQDTGGGLLFCVP